MIPYEKTVPEISFLIESREQEIAAFSVYFQNKYPDNSEAGAKEFHAFFDKIDSKYPNIPPRANYATRTQVIIIDYLLIVIGLGILSYTEKKRLTRSKEINSN